MPPDQEMCSVRRQHFQAAGRLELKELRNSFKLLGVFVLFEEHSSKEKG